MNPAPSTSTFFGPHPLSEQQAQTIVIGLARDLFYRDRIYLETESRTLAGELLEWATALQVHGEGQTNGSSQSQRDAANKEIQLAGLIRGLVFYAFPESESEPGSDPFRYPNLLRMAPEILKNNIALKTDSTAGSVAPETADVLLRAAATVFPELSADIAAQHSKRPTAGRRP